MYRFKIEKLDHKYHKNFSVSNYSLKDISYWGPKFPTEDQSSGMKFLELRKKKTESQVLFQKRIKAKFLHMENELLYF